MDPARGPRPDLIVRVGVGLLIGAAGLLRALAHDPQVLAQGERATSREVADEVADEVAEVTAAVRRCAPVVVGEDDSELRAARCHVTPADVEKSRRSQ